MGRIVCNSRVAFCRINREEWQIVDATASTLRSYPLRTEVMTRNLVARV